MKLRISPKSAKPSAFWPAKPAKPAVFGIGESIKHKFRVFQVYRFQNRYQSNTPLTEQYFVNFVEFSTARFVEFSTVEFSIEARKLLSRTLLIKVNKISLDPGPFVGQLKDL